MTVLRGEIAGQQIKIKLGNIANQKCDACIVPQYETALFHAGVNRAILLAGAEKGMQFYSNFLTNNPKLDFGEACITTSGGSKARYLVHAATIGTPKNWELATVRKAVFSALLEAQYRRLKIVALPALGTDFLGDLTPTQSAKAIMNGIQEFATGAVKFGQIYLIVDSQQAFDDFAAVLKKQSYRNVDAEPGQMPFNFPEWLRKTRKCKFPDQGVQR